MHNCHHLSGQGDAWRAAANAIEARYRFGLSATVGLDPVGENDATDVWLRAVCGPIVYEVAISTLIEAGYLVRPTIRFLRHGAPDLPYDRWSTRAYADGISKCEKRNERIVAEAARYAGRGLRVLVDVARVGHARALANACAKALPPGRVALLLGTSSSDERAAVVASWRRGEVLVVVGTILGEGVDIPELSVVINAEGGKANVSGLQRLRNLTLAPGKTEAIVVEFLDTHHPHLCDWTARRLALYRRERAFKIEAEPKGGT